MLAAESRLTAVAPAPSEPLAGWKHILEAADPFLRQVATRLEAQTREFDPEMAAYAQYALGVQGKQLRSLLVSLSAESVGQLNESHLTAAVIIEMVHLATLVHDDVIDEADLRRGRPTSAANWGNEIAVLLGDCLFAQALKLAASFPTPEVCRAVAAATNTVCAGEILQSQSRGNFEVTREHYFKVITMKTAELFALSCNLGAYLGQADPAQREFLQKYGKSLGTAYQLYDDCLDLLGSELIAGKTLGADLAEGKMTLPVLVARDRASAPDLELLRQWLRNWNPAFLPGLLKVLHKYDALSESRTVIQIYLTAAREAAVALPVSEGQTALLGLTHFLAEQTEALGVVY